MSKQKRINYLLLSSFLIASSILPSTIVSANGINNTTDTKKVNVGLEQGEFTGRTSESIGFGSHVIESKRKTVTASFVNDFGVIDARGTQEGWSVTVSATPFTVIEPDGGFATGTTAYSLPMGSLSLSSLQLITGVNQEPENIYPTINTVDVAIDMNQEIRIATANKGKGMGEYSLTFATDALSLVIDPITARIDKVNYPDKITPYQSTLTWNLISGPEGIYDNIEQDISNFEYIVLDDDNVSITGYKGNTKNIIIPTEIEGKNVTVIGDGAFMGEQLNSVILPEGITTIGENAFKNNSLKNIAGPSTLTYIGNGAFSDNQLGSAVILKNLITHIGDNAFSNNLLTITDIPDGVEYIGNNAFSNNLIKDVYIPNTVNYIGINAFELNPIETVNNYSSLDLTGYFNVDVIITNH